MYLQGHLKKSQRFQTNKHQAGEVVEVAQRLCQMIKGSSTKETAKVMLMMLSGIYVYVLLV